MSKRAAINTPAPDFTLDDFTGKPVSLSGFTGKRHVVLVLNRGFMWPFCRKHLAQLRQDFHKFTVRDAVIISVGTENARNFAAYWEENDLPFIGLPDEKRIVLKLYGQEVKLFKLGRMPAQMIVDKKGILRFAHYGHSMSDIPENDELLTILDDLQGEE